MRKPLVFVVLVALALLGIMPGSAMAKKKKAPPTCTLSASPNVLAHPGDPSTLSLTTTGAISFSISPIGNVPTSGALVVTPVFTTYYTGTVTGKGGTATCAVTIEVQSWNLVGDWNILLEKGIVVDDAEEGMGNPPQVPTDDTFFLYIQRGQVYEGGMHLYQGVLHGYPGSWVNVWFKPNMRQGQQKYAEITFLFPDTEGTYTFSCKLFLDAGETYGRGVMSGEYRYRESPGIAEVPDELFISTCRTWREEGRG
jgi:hypothetical protein